MCDSSSNSSFTSLTHTTTTNLELSPMSSKEEMYDKGQNNDVVPGAKQNQVGTVMLFGVPIVSLIMDGKERLCLAQISSTLLKDFSYNEIHNRRVALGINCVQCTPVQLEILRRAGAMPVTSRRCGMITRREAERLCKSFLGDHAPPQLPENFSFDVYHECGWGCRGSFVPSRYNSSRAKCIRCSFCQLFFSPNKFIFHSHRLPESRYVQPDAANFNSWRRHMKLCGDPPEEANSSNTFSDMATAQIVHAWEDVKAMFNGGTRKRLLAATIAPSTNPNRHSASLGANTGIGSGSSCGKGSSSTRNQSHGETQNSNGATAAHTHSRGGSSHQSKKDTAGSVTPSTTAAGLQNPTQSGYNHDAPHPTNFPHQSQNPFLNVSNPLLSPAGRLDSIWNPAISTPMNIGQGSGSRPCAIPSTAPFQSLPFHPLSIPWLRRPIFPFSHPFGPTLLNESGATAPEKLVNLAVARQNQSAFKPVSRSVEPLFNWLNGNNLGGAAGALALGHSVANATASLPEDLSLSSGTPGVTPSGNSPSIQNHFSSTNNLIASNHTTTFNLAKHLDSPPHAHVEKGNRGISGASKHHQIQILSAHHDESDDEENVDIESTAETEECSSTSSVWVSSTTALPSSGGGRHGHTMPRLASPYHMGHNNNNNNTINNNNSISFTRRKRSIAASYSSGDEMDEQDSDNQVDIPIDQDHYEEIRNSGEREKQRKRKRRWITDTTDDEDVKTDVVHKGKGSKPEKFHASLPRVLLDTRD